MGCWVNIFQGFATMSPLHITKRKKVTSFHFNPGSIGGLNFPFGGETPPSDTPVFSSERFSQRKLEDLPKCLFHI